MKHWTVGVRRVCMALGCAVILTGCAFQRLHSKSLPQMRTEAATNYAQQVLDSIIDVCEHARLPVFFSIEAGVSIWSPTYTGSAAASIPTLKVGQTSVTGSIGGGESLTDQLQYNDFGAAAMSRATSLFHLLCFEVRSPLVALPNGTLLTVVEKADSPERFILWGKMRHGQYIGVPPAKRAAFMQFAHDVTYWTRHATPDVHDLLSTTGKLYRFSAEYATVVANLVSARLAWFKTSEALAGIQVLLQAKQQAFEALKKEVRTASTRPLVLQTLLQVEGQELAALTQARAKLAEDRDKLDDTILGNSNRLITLEALFADILATLQRHDPALASLDLDALIVDLKKSDSVG